MNFFYAEGATPLESDDLQGLIPHHITTQEQLNEWEHANIVIAEKWAYARRHRDLLSVSFLRLLHKKMFDKTWNWAGKFRTKQTNIGVTWHHIQAQLKLLCDDFDYYRSINLYTPDELGVRFHHRLVLIHAFPNGNGRHSRLMANLLALNLGQKRFTWGLSNKLATLTTAGELRSSYLTALRKADQGEFASLIAFSRS
jgi:Fic-DOC domain mobile mystery protein B